MHLMLFLLLISVYYFQLQSEWAQVAVIELRNDGAGFGFGISGSRNSGAVVRNIFPGGAADRVSYQTIRRWKWKQTFAKHEVSHSQRRPLLEPSPG